MKQDYDGDYQIVVTLSEVDIDLFGGLPKNLETLMMRGVRIIRVQDNIKSYKKAFYVSDENIKFPIITIDDDILYPHWWLSEILQSAKNEPGCILAFRGHHILRGADDIIFDYNLWFKYSDRLTSPKPTYSFLPTGTSGVYYPVGSLNGLQSTKDDFLSICPDADDLWLKYITTINGFKAKRIRNNNLHFLCSDLSSSLHTINVHNGGNDIQFNGIAKYSEEFKGKIFSDALLFSDEVKNGTSTSISDRNLSQ
ncbi:hypothetical protein [Pantoea cypripedii]|nr:hypothetical protein [Pantoea cypripedii]